MYYILDTNIWVDVGQGLLSCSKLKKPGVEIALAPLMIIELVWGVVKGGESRFSANRALFDCMARVGSSVMELPRVAIFNKLWNIREAVSGVRPEHYMTLMNILIGSNSHKEFLAKAEAPGNPWVKLSNLDSIHKAVLDKELTALKPLAEKASVRTLHMHMVRAYQLGGLLPDPDLFVQTFSAAVEFLKYMVMQVRNGANPVKNNRGSYVDSQLFWYLGDPDAVVVSKEDFSNEIRLSPQKSRIISFSEFLLL
jgi:hypothetical protein